MFNLWSRFLLDFRLSNFILSSYFMLNSFMSNWLAVLLVFYWLMLSSFMFGWFMLSSNLVLDCLVLSSLVFLFVLRSFMFKSFMLKSLCWNNFLLLMRFFLLWFLFLFRMFRMFSCLLFNFLCFMISWFSTFSWVLLEFSWNESNSRPFLGMFFLLSTHLDKKSASQYFFIRPIFDKINRIDAGFKDDFERSWVIFLDFDELEVGEGLFNILLNSIEITFDQIKRDMLNIIC